MNDDTRPTFEKITDRVRAILDVSVHFESGCNPKDGEYSVYLNGIIGGSIHVSQFHLIEEAIAEDMGKKIPALEEGCVQVMMIEDGEWEDVFWNSYLTILSVTEIKE